MAPDPLRWTRRAVMVIWLAWAALYGLSAWQLFARVLQPRCEWILSIAVVEFAAVMVALSTGLFRVVRGPKRLAALTWLLAAALPILLIAAHASYGFWAVRTRSHPLTFRLRILSPSGEALCDAESRWRYPSWIEGDRVVMIGNPAETSAEAAAAMDRHVERMEAILGSRHPGKVRWVRGSLLGTDGRSMHGYAICGLRLGEDQKGLDYVDRHEVAHNVLNDQLPAMSHPPSIITEGWAQLQSDRSRARAATLIRLDQREGRELTLRQLLSSQWYDNADPQPYTYGEILVDYLVRRSGGAKLLEFCGACRPETIESDLQRVYDQDLDQLDAAFREHVREILYGKNIEKTQFGPVPDLPSSAVGVPVPRPPDDDHVLAKVMRGSLWAAAGTAALLVFLAGLQLAWSARRRLTTSSASA